MKFFLKKYWPFIILIAVITLLFGKALIPAEGRIIYGDDIYDAYYHWKGYLAESLRSGIIPFWNPYNFSGTPFLAHPNINIFYLPNWLFVLLPLNVSFSVYYYIHFIIAGINMYWLGLKYTDKKGAMVAALLYSTGGYFTARVHSGHLEYVDVASWIPLVFLLTREMYIKRSVKSVIYTSLSMAIMLLAGNELFFLFITELCLLYLAYLAITELKSAEWIRKLIQRILYFILSLGLSLVISAVGILPRLQFMSMSLRSQGLLYETAGVGSLPFEGLRLFLQPFYWGYPFRGNYSYHGPWPGHVLFNHYVGVLPIILLFVFITASFARLLIKRLKNNTKQNDIWFFILLVIPFFLVISFGTNIKPNIHEVLWKYTPLYKSIRLPARHLFPIYFSLCLITGILVGQIKNTLITLALSVIITFDVFSYSRRFIQTSEIPDRYFDQRLVETLVKDKELFRVLPDYTVVSHVRRSLDFGAAAKYKIQTTSDYNSMVLWNYYHFIELLNKAKSSMIPYYNVEIPPPDPWSSYINFLNVKYVLADKGTDPIKGKSYDKFSPVLEGDNYILYRNNEYLPRFVFVKNALIYDTSQEIELELLKGRDLSKNVLLKRNDIEKYDEIDIYCRQDTQSSIEILDFRANYIKLNTNNTCNAYLSTSEVYYPGWKAKIDDLDTNLLQSNLAFRTIFVPKGEHKIEFFYYPEIYFLGIMLSSIGIILIVVCRKY